MVRFAGLRGAHACAALSEAVARLEVWTRPFRLEWTTGPAKSRGSYGEAGGGSRATRRGLGGGGGRYLEGEASGTSATARGSTTGRRRT